MALSTDGDVIRRNTVCTDDDGPALKITGDLAVVGELTVNGSAVVGSAPVVALGDIELVEGTTDTDSVVAAVTLVDGNLYRVSWTFSSFSGTAASVYAVVGVLAVEDGPTLGNYEADVGGGGNFLYTPDSSGTVLAEDTGVATVSAMFVATASGEKDVSLTWTSSATGDAGDTYEFLDTVLVVEDLGATA